jgi:thioredoxin-related protein
MTKIRKELFITLLLTLSSYLNAQIQTGIGFIYAANWDTVVKLAKSNDKMIFVDIMATWCTACSEIDKIVYSDKAVGNFMNDRFISIKVQMDKKANDSKWVQSWYAEADKLKKEYQIEAFPTLLFFNSTGQLVHLESGYKDHNSFIEASKNALSSDYIEKVKQFESGNISRENLASLALHAKHLHNYSLSIKAAKQYKAEWLDKQNPIQFLSPNLMPFLYDFYELFSVEDKITKYLYTFPSQGDSLLDNKGYSKRWVDYMIVKKYIKPLITHPLPNWNNIEIRIGNEYDKVTAHGVVLNQKIEWNLKKENWTNYIALSMEKFNNDGIFPKELGGLRFNNFAYDFVLKYSDNKNILLQCIFYMEQLLKEHSDVYAQIDTYSCLLYKVGRIEKAVKAEQKALERAQCKNDVESALRFSSKIQKMREGLTFW